MESYVAGAYLILILGVGMVLFGLKNLFTDSAIGVFSLAAMAVYFGGLLSGVGIMLRRPSPPED